MLFALWNKKYFFGLPGNPVSTFVHMQETVLPFLYSLMGRTDKKKEYLLPMYSDYKRKKKDKTEFIPCQITESGAVQPVAYNGSAHIHSLVDAHGVIEIPSGVMEIKKEDKVKFIPLGD